MGTTLDPINSESPLQSGARFERPAKKRPLSIYHGDNLGLSPWSDSNEPKPSIDNHRFVNLSKAKGGEEHPFSVPDSSSQAKTAVGPRGSVTTNPDSERSSKSMSDVASEVSNVSGSRLKYQVEEVPLPKPELRERRNLSSQATEHMKLTLDHFKNDTETPKQAARSIQQRFESLIADEVYIGLNKNKPIAESEEIERRRGQIEAHLTLALEAHFNDLVLESFDKGTPLSKKDLNKAFEKKFEVFKKAIPTHPSEADMHREIAHWDSVQALAIESGKKSLESIKRKGKEAELLLHLKRQDISKVIQENISTKLLKMREGLQISKEVAELFEKAMALIEKIEEGKPVDHAELLSIDRQLIQYQKDFVPSQWAKDNPVSKELMIETFNSFRDHYWEPALNKELQPIFQNRHEKFMIAALLRDLRSSVERAVMEDEPFDAKKQAKNFITPLLRLFPEEVGAEAVKRKTFKAFEKQVGILMDYIKVVVDEVRALHKTERAVPRAKMVRTALPLESIRKVEDQFYDHTLSKLREFTDKYEEGHDLIDRKLMEDFYARAKLELEYMLDSVRALREPI